MKQKSKLQEEIEKLQTKLNQTELSIISNLENKYHNEIAKLNDINESLQREN